MKKQFSKTLRKNATETETILWYRLRNRLFLGYKFRRQAIIGPYIVDFLCPEKQLIIELDGGQHMDAIIFDEKRTLFLQTMGFKVIRFWNNEVKNNLFGVLTSVSEALKE